MDDERKPGPVDKGMPVDCSHMGSSYGPFQRVGERPNLGVVGIQKGFEIMTVIDIKEHVANTKISKPRIEC